MAWNSVFFSGYSNRRRFNMIVHLEWQVVFHSTWILKLIKKDMYLPGTCLSSIWGLNPPRKGLSIQFKTRVIWVPGIQYTLIHYIYMLHVFELSHWLPFICISTSRKKKADLSCWQISWCYFHTSHTVSDKIQGLHEEADLKKSGDHSLLYVGSIHGFPFHGQSTQPNPM